MDGNGESGPGGQTPPPAPPPFVATWHRMDAQFTTFMRTYTSCPQHTLSHAHTLSVSEHRRDRDLRSESAADPKHDRMEFRFEVHLPFHHKLFTTDCMGQLVT